MPIVVYRVYADGRPDELVRGADIVGTPLESFSKILATSDQPEVFNGYCGAESGSVPVSAIAPAILVSEIEIEKRSKSQDRPPLLPEPPAWRTSGSARNESGCIAGGCGGPRQRCGALGCCSAQAPPGRSDPARHARRTEPRRARSAGQPGSAVLRRVRARRGGDLRGLGDAGRRCCRAAGTRFRAARGRRAGGRLQVRQHQLRRRRLASDRATTWSGFRWRIRIRFCGATCGCRPTRRTSRRWRPSRASGRPCGTCAGRPARRFRARRAGDSACAASNGLGSTRNPGPDGCGRFGDFRAVSEVKNSGVELDVSEGGSTR